MGKSPVISTCTEFSRATRVVWNGLDTRGDADPFNDLDSAFLAPEPGAAALVTTALATLGALARRSRRR